MTTGGLSHHTSRAKPTKSYQELTVDAALRVNGGGVNDDDSGDDDDEDDVNNKYMICTARRNPVQTVFLYNKELKHECLAVSAISVTLGWFGSQPIDFGMGSWGFHEILSYNIMYRNTR